MVSRNYFYQMKVICLHIVIWFQLFTIIFSKQLYLQAIILNRNNLHLYGFKYSYQMQITFKYIYLTHRWDSNSYYPWGFE